MNQQLAEDILNQLQERKINEYHVKKEDFLIFQNVLVKRADFKHFRGEALRGGDIVFTYLDEARS